MTNPSATAFPDQENSGLTKREYFAAMAMQGLIAYGNCGESLMGEIANRSVEQADALVRELSK